MPLCCGAVASSCHQEAAQLLRLLLRIRTLRPGIICPGSMLQAAKVGSGVHCRAYLVSRGFYRGRVLPTVAIDVPVLQPMLEWIGLGCITPHHTTPPHQRTKIYKYIRRVSKLDVKSVAKPYIALGMPFSTAHIHADSYQTLPSTFSLATL